MNRQIKICFIAPKAYPLFDPQTKGTIGGAEVDLYYLSTELAKDENFDISFITADCGQQQRQLIENVNIIKSFTFRENPLSSAFKIWRVLKIANADIYIIKTISLGMFLVALFCRIHKKIFLYRTAHQNDCDGTYIKKHPFGAFFYKWSLKTASIVFTQNQKDKENLKTTTSIGSITIPNGHRLTPLTSEQRDTILWAGRSADFKRPQLFMDLARKLPQEKFTMICQRATGDEKYDIVNQTKKIDNLEFIERVPFHQTNRYFQQAKVFVNTSISEGFPNTFIQACMNATPILSMNVNPDGFLDKYNCGLCSEGDWDKFVDSLKFLLEQNRYMELGNNARRYVQENHDITHIVKIYKNMITDLISTEKKKERK
ncbi:MAG: glycosyltransferase family 4 protein [Planctomycetota bacterium]